MNRYLVISVSVVFLFLLSNSQIKKRNITDKNTTAVSFVVNSPNETGAWDNPDTPADETMDGICQDENGQCTLPAAMEEAMNLNAAVTITFSSPMSITLTSAAGFGSSLLSGSKILGEGKDIHIIGSPIGGIELIDNSEISGIKFDNMSVSMSNSNVIKGCTFNNTGVMSVGLIIMDGSNNVIGGLNASDRNIIMNGKAFGITIAQSTDGFNQILGNYIGVDESGVIGKGNMSGISISADAGQGKNIIEGNIVSGSTTNGIIIFGSDNNIVRNNNIGTDANAMIAIGNMQNGIYLVNASHNLIENNVIAGNIMNGILVAGNDAVPVGSSANIIKSNFIGVNKSEMPIPNYLFGIELLDNCNENIIGSTLVTELDTNVIAYNAGKGIVTAQSLSMFPQKNIFRRNRMYNNGDPGITLVDGSQGNIQVVIIDSIQKNLAGDLVVHGKGKPSAVVDVYLAAPNTSGLGEGKQWLGKGPVDANALFAVNIGAIQLNCDFITALQTDENGNTSANALNYGLRPSITSLTESCSPPLFGAIPYANNKYTVHIDWKGMPKIGEIEFTLNGNKKNGAINGDQAEVEYDMAQSIVGTNTLTWKLTTCTNRIATGLSQHEFCGNPVPTWLDPVTAQCSGGHMQYTHEETFPDVHGAAAAMGIPPSMAFVGGLLLSFADAPSFTTTLKIPGTSTPIESQTQFAIGDYRTSVGVSGTASTSFASCNNIDLTGSITLTAGVAKDYSFGFSFGTIPCPSIPGIEQVCQVANAISHSLRVGATLSGEISGTANLTEGIEITGGSGGATLALTPFLDIFPFHAHGTGQVAFSFEVPSFSITSVTPSLVVTISEALTGSSKSWSFPSAGFLAKDVRIDNKIEKKNFTAIPYKPVSIPTLASDTTLEKGIAWNAKPALAVGANGVKAFAWVNYSMNGGTKVSDIAMKYFDGVQWKPAVMLTNDNNIDRNPTVEVDNSGNIIVCWERNSLAQAFPDSQQYAITVIQNFDIMYSVHSPVNGTQLAVGVLGQQNRFDALPKLAKGKDGSVMLAWQTNNGDNMFGTDMSPAKLVVAHQWNSSQWNAFDTLSSTQSKMFQWDFAVHDGQNAILALAKDTQDDLSTGNDWEIFTIRKTNGAWEAIQQLTTNSIVEYGVNAAYTYDGTPVVTWMRDTSIVGSFGAVSSSQEIWFAKAGMGFFHNAFAIGKDTMTLMWNEGTSTVLATASVVQRQWSTPKFINFTTDIQRSVSSHFDMNGSLHVGYQQSPYSTQSNQFSDSGSLRLISLEKISSPLGVSVNGASLPKRFALLEAYPNPFNASATIKFTLPKQAYTTLTVTNILGHEVARLVERQLIQGEHSFQFNADRLASGVYFYTLRSGDIIQTKKMMLVK